MFGWDWDFEIIDQLIEHGEVIVKGKLTCRTAGKTIVKMQFGNKDIVTKKGTSTPLSIGNDMKAAATDCLKKCAAEIGIAADIYNKDDFREVKIITDDDQFEILFKLWNEKKAEVKSDYPDEYENINRVVTEKESTSYKKAIQRLRAL